MPIDRAATLRNAEKLLLEGKLDSAIAEYLRVVEEEPRDWNTANLVGDLYLRGGKTDQAVDQFIRIADSLSAEGFLPKAGALYKKILKIKPDDEHALLQAAEIAARQGLLADARANLNAVLERRRSQGDDRGVEQIKVRLGSLDPEDTKARLGEYLTDETAADDPGRLLTAAEIHIRAGRIDDGIGLAKRVLGSDPTRCQDVAALGWAVAADAPDVGFQIVDLAAESAVASSDWPSAAAALQEFVTRVPNHVPALMRLVEVCVDGGLEATMYSAQAQLADAYIAAGAAVEARSIAQDLVAREPWERANVERFRRALVMMGEGDPDAIIAERLSGQVPFMSTDLLGPENISAEKHRNPSSGLFELSANAIDLETVLKELEAPLEGEVDLSAALDGTMKPAEERPAPSQEDTDLEAVFARMRDDVSQGSTYEAAEEEWSRAMSLYEAGKIDECIPVLQSASRDPRLRFPAASLLARIYSERGMTMQAIEWFERAAEAPPPTVEEGQRLLYELADALESVGEPARALAIYIELQAAAGSYRDVEIRVGRLTKAQARARG